MQNTKTSKKQKIKRAAKIGATVAGASLAAYGVYKVSKYAKNVATKKAYETGKRAATKYISDKTVSTATRSLATSTLSTVKSLPASTAKTASSAVQSTGKKVVQNAMNSTTGYSWESSIKQGKDLLDELLKSY